MFRLVTTIATSLASTASASTTPISVLSFRSLRNNVCIIQDSVSSSCCNRHHPLPFWFSTIRGGGPPEEEQQQEPSQQQQFETLSEPAPGSPFHYAFPVHDLEIAKEFYGTVLGCQEGRSSEKWQDYSLHGHQIVCHWVGNDYRCQDYYNPVDGDEVPVPHAGLALRVDEFHALAKRLQEAGIEFIIEPHLRFQGQPGEQYTMFFKDPSGNNLEFKAMTKVENLFAKYNVVDPK